MSEQTKHERPSTAGTGLSKSSYQSPTLTRFGAVRELTTSGSHNGREATMHENKTMT
jgi:hypothetical protein